MEKKQFNKTEAIRNLKNQVLNGSPFGEEFHKLLKFHEDLENEKQHNGVTLESHIILLCIANRFRDIEILKPIYKVNNNLLT
jgi:hypothetical protein